MKKSIIIILLAPWVLNAQSQDVLVNFEEATTLAQENDQHVLMVFSGSDWCKPCIQFRKDIIESTAFQEYLKNNLVHLELDFPYSKKNKQSKDQVKHNERLADKYNPDGEFPKIMVVNTDGSILSHLTYEKGLGPQEFINQLKSIEYE